MWYYHNEQNYALQLLQKMCRRVAGELGCYEQPFISNPGEHEARKTATFNFKVGGRYNVTWIRAAVEFDVANITVDELTERVRAELIRRLIRKVEEISPRSDDRKIADQIRGCNVAATRLRAGQSEEARRKYWN